MKSPQKSKRPIASPVSPASSPSRPASLREKRPKRRSHGALAGETVLKIVINGVLSAAAIAALTNLLPYYWEQREKVQALRAEVRETEYKVTRLRSNLSRSFDPSQALNVMQEQSAMVAPNQRRIVLMEEE